MACPSNNTSEIFHDHGDNQPAVLLNGIRLDLPAGVALSGPFAVELEIAPEARAPKLGRKSLPALHGGDDFAFCGAALQKAIQGVRVKADAHADMARFAFI
jgi:hypothetical protein